MPSTLLRSATLLARHPHTVSTAHPILRKARRTRSSRFLLPESCSPRISASWTAALSGGIGSGRAGFSGHRPTRGCGLTVYRRTGWLIGFQQRSIWGYLSPLDREENAIRTIPSEAVVEMLPTNSAETRDGEHRLNDRDLCTGGNDATPLVNCATSRVRTLAFGGNFLPSKNHITRRLPIAHSRCGIWPMRRSHPTRDFVFRMARTICIPAYAVSLPPALPSRPTPRPRPGAQLFHRICKWRRFPAITASYVIEKT